MHRMGRGQVPCTARSKLNKFEHVGEGQWMVRSTPVDRQTDRPTRLKTLPTSVADGNKMLVEGCLVECMFLRLRPPTLVSTTTDR